MKALKKVILVVLLLPILLLLVSLFLPSRYHVERRLVMQAPPEAIFPWLHQVKRWPEWTAWTVARDPSLAYNYPGPSAGVGAISSWTSKSGNGTLKLTAADPRAGVQFDLDFDQGKFLSKGAIRMSAAEGGTQVTWTNEGELGRNPVARYFGLFMDRMMGGDFETGLRNLKIKAESKPAP